jgi:hypothetical protein
LAESIHALFTTFDHSSFLAAKMLDRLRMQPARPSTLQMSL